MVAYADKVTIFATSPDNIRTIRDAIRCYEAASGARLNVEKSKAMAIESWDTSTDIMGIPYLTEMMILGVRINDTVAQSANNSWSSDRQDSAQYRDAYNRDLFTDQRILHVRNFLFAKAWYTAHYHNPFSQ